MRRRSWVLVAVAAGFVAVGGAAVLVTYDPSVAGPRPSVSLPAVQSSTPFPDASSTGVPAGVELTASGGLDIGRAGTVVDGLDIDGCVDVRADNVTIRNSRIRCARPTTAVRLFDDHHGLLIEDVEIDGNGIVSTAVGFSDYTLLRVDIHDVIDGPRLGDNTVMQDCYVHDLVRAEGSHNDAVQVTGGSGIVIRHNTLDAYSIETGDYFNSAIMVGSSSAPVDGLLIEDNYLNGGNYTVNFHPNLHANGVVGRNNVFGPDHRYGPLARGEGPGIQWTGQPFGDPTGD